MDGHAVAPGDEAHDLVSRNRRTALGETHCHIIHALDHDTTLTMGTVHLLLAVLFDYVLICKGFLLILIVLLNKLVYYLAFLYSTVTYGSHNGIPVLEIVLL